MYVKGKHTPVEDLTEATLFINSTIRPRRGKSTGHCLLELNNVTVTTKECAQMTREIQFKCLF